MAKDHPTSARFPPEILKRLDALVPVLQRTAYGDLGSLTRSKVMRLAVMRGIDVLEEEARQSKKGTK